MVQAHFRRYFVDTKDLEKKIENLEELFVLNNIEQNRTNLNQKKAELTRHLKIKHANWKQKANLQCTKERDLNTPSFHASITRKRRRLTIQKIKDEDDQWLENKDQIANEVVRFFENIFKKPQEQAELDSLDCIN